MRSFFSLIALTLWLFMNQSCAQLSNEPWSPGQLMPAADLASAIRNNKTKDMLILTVGPDAVIKGSVDIGPAGEKENVDKLRKYLKDVPKDKEVVIYCGCCPFSRCPNVRPAFRVLNQMGFKNARLLDIPKNIKADWLDKGYPATD